MKFTCDMRFTHSGRVTHICVAELNMIGPDNGFSPGQRQAIIWTNDGILLIRPLRINFSEILIEIHTFSFKTMYLKYRLSNGGQFVSAQCVNILVDSCVLFNHPLQCYLPGIRTTLGFAQCKCPVYTLLYEYCLIFVCLLGPNRRIPRSRYRVCITVPVFVASSISCWYAGRREPHIPLCHPTA